jgi:hypothetical protein
MSGHERKGGTLWWGPPAGTNGPGRLDGRGSPQIANFMTYPATESFRFSIGSTNTPKCIKKPRQAHFQCKTSTGGTDLHKRHFDVDPMETARRAEANRRADYDRRAEIARADYDRRVETARRDEYDRRREYDLSALCKMSTAEDFELQVRRLDEMGKIIDTLTTMLTKPHQPQGSATEKITLLRSCSQTQAYEECEDWSLQRTDKERGALNELMEPGEYEREVKAGLGFDRASEDELKERHTVKICRRGTAFQYRKDPGFHRAQEDELKARKILKICRKTAEEGLVGTLPVADALAHAPREATRGAEGWAAGLQRKEKAIQKRRLRKLSRFKRAGEYWKKGSPTQETSGASNNTKERHKIRTSARVLRTSDPKIRTKIKYNNNGGKTEGVIQRGVMSLEIFISTKREKMNLTTLVTKRTSKKAKCYGIYKRCTVIIKKRNGSEQKDWWKRPASCKMNTKRKSRKGSTDVYLLKRTIELEID